MATSIPSGPPNPITAPASPPPTAPLSWDGDRMFNIYILDYCQKRGFSETAKQLSNEADLPQDAAPPINAKQGLLFEWWSVFWVLFTAKSSGQGTEDAMLYTQHQTQQNAQRQAQMRNQPPNGRPFVNGRPGGAPSTNGIVGGAHNGMPGGLPNGAGGPLQGGPLQGGPLQGGPLQYGNGAGGPQTNGMTMSGPSGAPAGGVGSAPGQPPTMGQLMPGQRPLGVGPARGGNGVPFQSPTMGHSPHNPGGQQGANGPPAMTGMGGAPPLAQMNRGGPGAGVGMGPGAGGMLPPGGPPFGGPAQQTPQTSFTVLGRSPSAPGSPGNMLSQPSPSMAARQAPGADPRMAVDASAELIRIPHNLLNQLKQDIGLGERDLLSLNAEEKRRIVELARRRGLIKNGGQPNAAAGPSGVNASMPPHMQQRNPPMGGGSSQLSPGQGPPQQPSQQQQAQQQQQQAQQQAHQQAHQQQQQLQQQQRGNKRNSNSPGQEHEQLSRNESSPPDRKRVRRSPAGPDLQQQQPQQPGPPTMQFPPPHQGGGGPPMPNGLMRGFAPPGAQGMPPGPQGMGMGMNPAMGMGMGHPGPGGAGQGAMMTQQQALTFREMQYRQSMRELHKNNLPHGVLTGLMPGGPGAGGPPGGSPAADGQFSGDGPQSRPGTGQFPGPQGPGRLGQPPKPMGMMPPPSPGMVKKEPSVPEGAAQNGAAGSPHNAPPPTPQQQQQQQQQGGTPLTPSASGGGMAVPSPGAILGASGPGGMHGMPTLNDPIGAGLFGADFMTSSLEDFDPTNIFGARDEMPNVDFDHWFSADAGGMD